jgi:hypothetical protein
LASTKKYIEDFWRVLADDPKDSAEVVTEMAKLYPDWYNPSALKVSAAGVFIVLEERI